MFTINEEYVKEGEKQEEDDNYKKEKMTNKMMKKNERRKRWTKDNFYITEIKKSI